MNDEEREMRRLFLPIAVVEHHLMLDPELSAYDLADRLAQVWQEIQTEAHANAFTLEADCILALNERVAKAFGVEAGTFRDRDNWAPFVEACGNIEENTIQMCSWMFSSLYWRHLTRVKLSTAWLYTSALRIQHGFEAYRLTLDRLGPFLDSLSGSGPPLYDGQTFYPEDYST